MKADVVYLPRELRKEQVEGRTVVVLDVIRATTSIAAALAAGVSEIRVFDTLEGAREAAAAVGAGRLLCGEHQCLPPKGFDLGNSPRAFGPEHRGRVMLLATTNGTRAISAARGAAGVLTGALVNATAVGRAAVRTGKDVTLLCAGTQGEESMEDIIGAGAVLAGMEMVTQVELISDRARVAAELFKAARVDLRRILERSQGGMNVAAAGLGEDLGFVARLDGVPVVGQVLENPLRVVVLPD